MKERYEDFTLDERLALLAGRDLPDEWQERMATELAEIPEAPILLGELEADRRELGRTWALEPDEILLAEVRSRVMVSIEDDHEASLPPQQSRTGRSRTGRSRMGRYGTGRSWLAVAASLLLVLGAALLHRGLESDPAFSLHPTDPQRLPIRVVAIERFDVETRPFEGPLTRAISVIEPPSPSPAMEPPRQAPELEKSAEQPGAARIPSPTLPSETPVARVARAEARPPETLPQDRKITWITDDPKIVIHWLVDGSL